MQRPPPTPADEVTAGAATAPIAAVLRAVVVAAGVMLLFGAEPLRGWAERLPVHPVSDVVLSAADAWYAAAAAVGLTVPYAWLRALAHGAGPSG